MTETLQIPVWVAVVLIVAVGVLVVGLLFWHGTISTEHFEREKELDERTARLARIEGEQVAKEIRRAWDVALPGLEESA